MAWMKSGEIDTRYSVLAASDPALIHPRGHPASAAASQKAQQAWDYGNHSYAQEALGMLLADTTNIADDDAAAGSVLSWPAQGTGEDVALAESVLGCPAPGLSWRVWDSDVEARTDDDADKDNSTYKGNDKDPANASGVWVVGIGDGTSAIVMGNIDTVVVPRIVQDLTTGKWRPRFRVLWQQVPDEEMSELVDDDRTQYCEAITDSMKAVDELSLMEAQLNSGSQGNELGATLLESIDLYQREIWAAMQSGVRHEAYGLPEYFPSTRTGARTARATGDAAASGKGKRI